MHRRKHQVDSPICICQILFLKGKEREREQKSPDDPHLSVSMVYLSLRLFYSLIVVGNGKATVMEDLD